MANVGQEMFNPPSIASPENLRSASDYQDDVSTYMNEDLILKKVYTPKKRGLLSIFALSVCFGALQTVFAVLSTYGTLHLTSMGLSKSTVALAWLAGPIAGTIVQPYCGICSDRSKIRWGRRIPFVVGGSAAIVITFVGLAWAPDLISQEVPRSGKSQFLGQAVAILSIVLLQVGIQPVQMGLRALIIDTCPPQQQSHASVWVARMIGIGNILGQLAGSIDIPKKFPFLAKTQLKDLCMLSSSLLSLAVIFLYISIKEQDPNDSSLFPQENRDQRGDFMVLWVAVRTLPKDVKDVWVVQFFSWMGWFPFISYITTFFDHISPHMNDTHTLASFPGIQSARDESLRTGSRAMLLYAFVSFSCSIILPSLLEVYHCFTLPRLWLMSQVLFATAMLGTIMVSSTFSLTILIGSLGISWACTIWIPFLLISERTSKTIVQASWNERQDVPAPGLVMSLHNVSIAAPQIVSALLCSAVFWAVREGKDGMIWVLAMGGSFGIGAAWFAKNLKEGGGLGGALEFHG